MKKVIILFLAVILGLSFVMVAPLSAQDATTTATVTSNAVDTRVLVGGREKILTPVQICLYKDIVRHGNTLYGVKKSETEISQMSTTTCPVAAPILEKFNKLPEQATAMVRQLEKIAAPWFVHQYDQIRQVGTALWGFKKETATSTPNTTPNQTSTTTPTTIPMVQTYVTPEKAACVISAIKVKDLALINSNASTIEALNNAISARTLCQETAINLTASTTATSTASTTLRLMQKEQLMACNQTFQTVFAALKTAANNRHVSIWTTYRNALKACQPVTTESPDLIIEDGGGSLF